MYTAYTILLCAALLFSTPWWLLQMVRHGKYRAGWGERLGRVPDRLFRRACPGTIWIHAVSVGEVLAVSALVQELKSELPGWRIVVSTTTDTGQQLARKKFGADDVFYAPLDLPFAVNAYLKHLRPKLLILAESEFWPNLLRLARKSGAKVAVVNARVSDRSLPRYRHIRPLMAHVMGNVERFLVQSEEDALRLIQIGAPADRVQPIGNLKFDLTSAADASIVPQLRSAIEREGISPVIIGGSTLEGEETMLLSALQSILPKHPKTVLVLAPRHPERFPTVESLLTESGLRWRKRSDWDGHEAIATGVFLLNTIGELAGVYQFADLAFVGGSLVPKGGHNILEAATFGVPILVGPSTENFRDIVDIFLRAHALRVVYPESLTSTVLELLDDEEERKRLGCRAQEVMHAQQGATERTVRALTALLPELPSRSQPELVSKRRV